MKEERKNKGVEGNKKKIIALAVALVLLIGGTYAWLTITLKGTKTTRIEAGTLSLELVDEANAIDIKDALPMSDSDGEAQENPYTFTLNNNGNIPSVYTLYLDSAAIEDGLVAMPQNRVKWYVVKTVKQIVGSRDSLKDPDDQGTDTIVSSTVELGPDVFNSAAETASSVQLDTGTLAAKNYIEYELRLWIDSEASNEEMENAAFSGKLRIEATQEGIEEDQAYAE